ncbi:rhombosortase [Horticoccus luteus]|uniref:Rhombosortase n=1 Tax=Horticoccus luteus TaxID=2862869 RepID=A0A8F9TTH0_9BACT|nr:rhombosortase [Horticoccus luteus]QYM77802.1 rhombosortase [Horticoccus luteus]
MNELQTSLRRLFARDKFPWVFLALTIFAVVIQLHPAWRAGLIYDRRALQHGEIWRLWSGHFVHFGWPHLVADAGLFLILGRLLERKYPVALRISAVLMPVVISVALYTCDPALERYAGLSAVNLGLLLFYAFQGWQRNRWDWFWPTILAIYIGEVVLEATRGQGHGGGFIQFDDPSIHVATSAHIAGGLYGFALWLCCRRRAKPNAG